MALHLGAAAMWNPSAWSISESSSRLASPIRASHRPSRRSSSSDFESRGSASFASPQQQYQLNPDALNSMRLHSASALRRILEQTSPMPIRVAHTSLPSEAQQLDVSDLPSTSLGTPGTVHRRRTQPQRSRGASILGGARVLPHLTPLRLPVVV